MHAWEKTLPHTGTHPYKVHMINPTFFKGKQLLVVLISVKLVSEERGGWVDQEM